MPKEKTIMFLKQLKLRSYLRVKCIKPEKLSALFFWKHSHAIVVGVAECVPCRNTNLHFEWKPPGEYGFNVLGIDQTIPEKNIPHI